jgi:hypothetical protein
MINQVLVGPAKSAVTDHDMGIANLKIYGKSPNENSVAITPASDIYYTWDDPNAVSVSFEESETLTAVKLGERVLEKGEDYTVSGNEVSFSKSYLETLPVRSNEFTLEFAAAPASAFVLDVTMKSRDGSTTKIDAIEGVNAFDVFSGAFESDEPVEGVTKRIRNAYNALPESDPQYGKADEHLTAVFNGELGKHVFQLYAHNALCKDGCYGHKNNFDPITKKVADTLGNTDRQRIEIRPGEDANDDLLAKDGDLTKYEWDWYLDDSIYRVDGFCHLFQLKAVNAQGKDEEHDVSTGENGAYILAFSIGGSNNTRGPLVLNHNRFDGDQNLMSIPSADFRNKWIHVSLEVLNSDAGWISAKVTDKLTGEVLGEYITPDVLVPFNKNSSDGVRDVWRRAEVSSFESVYPATFDQYSRPKWGIYRSLRINTADKPEAKVLVSDITITKESGVGAVNLALGKKAYIVGLADEANAIQLAASQANEYGNANRLVDGVPEDNKTYSVENVEELSDLGIYGYLGTDGANRGSFVIDLGEAMDFSQLRLMSMTNTVKGITVYTADDTGDYASAAALGALSFTQVAKVTDGYTYRNPAPGTSSTERASYPVDLGKAYTARYIKVTVETANGTNQGSELTGPPRLTEVQVFNAPSPVQNARVNTMDPSGVTISWDEVEGGEGYIVYNGSAVLAQTTETSYNLGLFDIAKLSAISVRTKGTDKYSRKYMVSAPAAFAQSTDPAVSLNGDAGVETTKVAAYRISAANMPRLATATFWFEVEDKFLEGKDFTGLNGFDVIGGVQWTQNGDKWLGRVTVGKMGGGIDIAASTDIFEMTYTAKEETGETKVALTKVELSGYNEENVAVYIKADVANDTVTTNVGQHFSRYDINLDGEVNQLDLTTAQRYYAARAEDANWEDAKRADLNDDARVDIEDYIILLNNIEW